MLKKPVITLISLSLIYTSILGTSFGAEKEQVSAPNLGASKAGPASTNSRSSTMLYGRIEQIAGSTGAQFPIELKAQTAKLDTRERIKITQSGQASVFSGSVVRSFPQQFTGVWGGHLKIWSSQIDPICWQIDADEANRTKQLMVPGREGTVNFDFAQSTAGKIDLEPAQIVFMVPMKETHMQEQLNSMLGAGGLGQASGLTLPGMDSTQIASMMQRITSTMNVPIMVNFGAINRTDVEGVSGNTIRATVLRNTIRQLGPGVLEQQIITQENQRNNKTGKARQEYSETVIRFTSQTANDLYVQAAAVNYTSNRQFERKLILYGSIRRGEVMQDASNPLGGLNSQFPQLPGGQNPFQNLLPH